MLVQILIDNNKSWIIPYAQELASIIKERYLYNVSMVYKHKDVTEGEILLILSCEKRFNELSLNKHNLVIHESDLPRGKGWSPITWQILEGRNKIPVTLFEAEKELDSGVIYHKDFIHFNGGELHNEIRDLQGEMTIKLVLEFLNKFPYNTGEKQKGKATFYSKRTPINSELDINKTIKEQFNLLRVCDNDRYPSFFILNNRKYFLKIFDEK